MMEPVEMLDQLLADIDKLKEARSLLHKIWQEVGPYGGEISAELVYLMQDFFGFDDSE